MKRATKALDILLKRYPVLENSIDSIYETVECLTHAFTHNHTLFICGNGGSAADADHIVGELMKSFACDRPLDETTKKRLRSVDAEKGELLAELLENGVPAIALTQHQALSTAFQNDVHPMLSFSQQLNILAKSGDIFLGLSTSGNSQNVVYAAVTAKALGMKTIALTGKEGGELKQYCDICITVPEVETYKVQELHMPIYHAVCLSVEEILFN